MTVVAFPPVSETKDQRAERLWAVYVEVSKKAQASLRIEDGIAAGKAWAEFMKAFEQAV